MSDSITQKRCSKCEEVKSIDHFSISRMSDDGRKYYKAWCKKCHADRASEVRLGKKASAPSITEKRCTRCGETKSIDQFIPAPLDQNKSGYKSWCQACATSHKKVWYRNRAKLSVTSKECSGCHQVKPVDQFSKHIETKDGYKSKCKDCCNAKDRDRRTRIAADRASGILPIPIEKFCPKCQRTLPADNFNPNNDNSNGLSSWCKFCNNERAKDRSYDQRRKNLLNNFGLTIEQYDQMLSDQNGVCACCKRPEIHINPKTKMVQPLSVDHDHRTGKVRALLCHSCNTAYGQLKEDENRILSLLNYHRFVTNS